VDVLPAQFLALLELPEGPVASGGGAMALSNPNVASGTKITVQVLELTAERARLKTVVASDTQADTAPAEGDEDGPTEASASAGGDEDGMAAMGMGVPGMGAMPGMGGLPGMGGAPGKKPSAGGAPSMSMGLSLAGDFVTTFDVKAGMLSALEGALSTDTNAAGMKMGTRSALKLTRL
jgi:hypothetical protein